MTRTRNILRPACGLALLLLALAGCRREEEAVPQPSPEIRGAPIQRLVRATNAPASNTAAVTAQLPAPTLTNAAGFAEIGFDRLSGYNFEMTDDILGPATNDVAAVAAKTDAQIPETVKAFDKQRVAVRGFMLPLKVEGGLVSEFLVMKDQSMCCYGTVPKINEWISVKMAEKGVRPFMDQPAIFLGTLHVGEMRENGYLVGIYRMDGEKMTVPED
jgi:hypothetical protein